MTEGRPFKDRRFSTAWSGAFIILLIVVISYFFFKIIRPFAVAIFLGAILTSLFYPLYRWLRRRMRGRESLASFTACFIILLVIILPIAGILTVVARQAIDFYDKYDDSGDSISEDMKDLTREIDVHGFLERIGIERSQIMEKINELGRIVSAFLVKSIQRVTKGAINVIATSLFVFFSMYYFFKDGPAFLARIRAISPLSDEYEDRIIGKFISMTRATLKGTLVVSAIQGGIGALAFSIFDVQPYLFWGLIMAVLAMIPYLGTAIIWAPAGLVKIFTGDTAQGIGILVVGVTFISTIDNILKPFLVGKDTEMHPLLILFGTLGGIAAFGIVGFLIGPIIVALFVTIWDIYATEFRT